MNIINSLWCNMSNKLVTLSWITEHVLQQFLVIYLIVLLEVPFLNHFINSFFVIVRAQHLFQVLVIDITFASVGIKPQCVDSKN